MSEFDLNEYLISHMIDYFPEATDFMIDLLPDEEAIEIKVFHGENDDDPVTTWRGEAGSDDDWFCFKATDNGQILTIPFPPEYNEE